MLPPVAEIGYEYALPDCAPGTDVVVIAIAVEEGADVGATEIDALADFVESATLVALTVTLVAAETVGAVKSPADEIDPLLADHETEVFVAPCTLAANCFVFPDVRLAVVGETEMLTVVVLGSTVTTAFALLVGSAALVARTVTLVGLLTLGAVNLPPSVIEPELADQLTRVLLVP